MTAFRTALALCAAWLVASQAIAETALSCDNGIARVTAPDAALAETICAMTDASLARFDTCSLGTLAPVEILVVESLDANCVGLYHCGQRKIEILSPPALDAKRDTLELFGHLEGDALLESILHHELSHALFDGTPCPYESCVATSEYFAYSQQIAALSAPDRAVIEARIDPDEPVRRDRINAIILYMAPGRFISSVWAHFTERAAENQCQQWQQLLNGAIVFDTMHP